MSLYFSVHNNAIGRGLADGAATDNRRQAKVMVLCDGIMVMVLSELDSILSFHGVDAWWLRDQA
jgi:hypothetical protein